MTEYEVYPNAPVVLVTMEVRHPAADPLTPTESRAIKKLLGDLLPIERSGQDTSWEFAAGGGAPVGTTEQFHRYVSRDSTTSVLIRKETMVIETSAYQGWESFRSLVLRVVDARMEIAPIVGIERLGLRYIDEIRAPANSDGSVQWSSWVHESLLGPRAEPGIKLPLDQWQGLGMYGAQPGEALVLRYGPRTGYAVDPDSDLRRLKQVSPGLFFLIDIDSFWTHAESIPEYNREAVRETCDNLHAPIRSLFEGLITDRLRNEVLRRNG